VLTDSIIVVGRCSYYFVSPPYLYYKVFIFQFNTNNYNLSYSSL